MANLTISDKEIFEELFKMKTGYLMEDLTKTKFKELVLEATEIDIDEDKYKIKDFSKAKQLRFLWDQENKYIVGKLLLRLLDYWEIKNKGKSITQREIDLFEEGSKRAKSLIQDSDQITVSVSFEAIQKRII